jgi:hypothetical protein
MTDLTNDSYTILLHTPSGTERYYRAQRTTRDRRPWVKVSLRGNEFRATAEQVLNHVLPVLAGVNAKVRVEVQHHPMEQAHGHD